MIADVDDYAGFGVFRRLGGWDRCGTIDRLGIGESIETRFFRVIIPVWHGPTIYITRDGDEERHIEIPRQTRSVVLGYLRSPLWLCSILFVVASAIDPILWGRWLEPGLALAAVAAVLTFVVGKLRGPELERRLLLRRVTGLGAPPELLPRHVQVEICDRLVDTWRTESRRPWAQAIVDGVPSELLVALADYHDQPALLLQARSNLLDDLRVN
ncbi:MAG: hypothetical protein WKG01_15375 [Kofleriaceae bacterium]